MFTVLKYTGNEWNNPPTPNHQINPSKICVNDKVEVLNRFGVVTCIGIVKYMGNIEHNKNKYEKTTPLFCGVQLSNTNITRCNGTHKNNNIKYFETKNNKKNGLFVQIDRIKLKNKTSKSFPLTIGDLVYYKTD
eukprot:92528_1